MDNTALLFCFEKDRFNHFFDSSQFIYTKDQDVFYTWIFKFIRNNQPVFRTFVITKLNDEYFFFSFVLTVKSHMLQPSICSMILS